MANLMSNFKLKNKPSRSGFDLTKRTTFSAKIGELLPVYCKEVLPGDNFKFHLQSFSRLQPLAAPAFVRLREYYDFVYVPTRLLWRYADSLFDQMPNFSSSNSNASEQTNISSAPFVTRLQVNDALARLSNFKDSVGFSCRYGAEKILDLLGYGQVWHDGNSDADGTSYRNTAFNIFPVLAYQKAYCDIFRFDQWEMPSPHTFNVDYADSGQNLVLTDIPGKNNFFTLRYANYPKDLLFGLLPNTQYGDVSVVATTSGLTALSSVGGSTKTPAPLVVNNASSNQLNSKDKIDKYFKFDILALRQAELLQKYKEISLTSKQDHAAQLQAHWNVRLSKGRSLVSEYLGGISQNVQIDSVVNQNLSASDSQSDLRGIGMSGTNGKIDYNVPEHGYILCIYHCSPIIDYDGSSLIFPQNLHLAGSDFAIPELDRAGMQSVPIEWYLGSLQHLAKDGNESDPGVVPGYAPRYVEYKTDVDTAHGLFSPSYATEFSSWVSPLRVSDIYTRFSSDDLTYESFKVFPKQFDNLFKVNADASVKSDQILCCADFDVKAVRNLDYDGMPY